jgi:CDP-diglyceride synthetase
VRPGELKTLRGGEMAGEPGIGRFKNLCGWLVIALVVVVALAGFNVAIPAGKPAASNWRFAAGHPTILLHMIAASVVLVLAVIAVIRTISAGDRLWIALSVIGLVFVLLAFASGVDYVGTLRKSALSYMSIGWVGSVVAYGAGWFLGRRRQRQQASTLAAGR